MAASIRRSRWRRSWPCPGKRWRRGRRHWAWITAGFLDWDGGFGGRIVVHGHTPPAKQKPFTGLEDPHVLHQDRLNLDGGSAVTGIVAGAQIETGRYRILRATQAA